MEPGSLGLITPVVTTLVLMTPVLMTPVLMTPVLHPHERRAATGYIPVLIPMLIWRLLPLHFL